MKEKIVYAYVVADLLHVGHIIALENAKSFGDKLIVGVLTDEAVIEKKPKPILSFDERIKLIKSLQCVDIVVAQQTYSPIQNIQKISPDILMESDSHSEEDLEETKRIVESYGGRIILLPYYQGKSSSDIKNDILNNWEKTNEKSYVNTTERRLK